MAGELEEQVRAIASEVLEAERSVSVHQDGAGHWVVGVELLNEDTGELCIQALATTRGDVVKPAFAASRGLSAQVEELALRLGALGVRPEDALVPADEDEAELIPGALEDLRHGLDLVSHSLPEILSIGA